LLRPETAALHPKASAIEVFLPLVISAGGTASFVLRPHPRPVWGARLNSKLANAMRILKFETT